MAQPGRRMSKFYSILQQQYSLFELNEHLRRVIALNFQDALWVRAEILQVGESRGHYFLDLGQKEADGEDLIARAQGVIWKSQARKLQRQLPTVWSNLLASGMEVLLQVRMDFNERYGLKLIIEDIDPNYTLGVLEQEKQATRQRLQREGLLQHNGALPLPQVLQRIAVISSEQAAGLQDFKAQLQHNASGYHFVCQYFYSAVQGAQAAQDISKQLKEISRQTNAFDCVVIIRGGGARLDLAVFDHYAVGKAISNCPLPVLTGVGHETDESIADLCAYRALKTPTAVAEFLLMQNRNFEDEILEQAYLIQQASNWQINAERSKLQLQQREVRFFLRQQLQEQEALLKRQHQDTIQYSQWLLQRTTDKLQGLQEQLSAMDPKATLKRGYALISQQHKLLRSIEEVQEKQTIDIRLSDGTFRATPTKGNEES